jgi:hypothetical protein
MLEFELLRYQQFATRHQARRAVVAWIDKYDAICRHSSNGMLASVAYERVQAAASAPTPRQRPAGDEEDEVLTDVVGLRSVPADSDWKPVRSCG